MQNLSQASRCKCLCTQDHQMLQPFRQSTSRHTSQHHLFSLSFHWSRHHKRATPCRTKVSASTIQISMVTNTHEKWKEHIFWNHCHLDFCKYGNALASIPDLGTAYCTRTDTHFPSLSTPPPTTCFSSDKYHLKASHLRQKNFQECARLVAITSNATAKVALKSMLKSEAATAAFGKPKHYVKGEHCTALQQVRITIFDSDSQPTVSTSLLQTP